MAGELIAQGYEGMFWKDRNVLYLDCDALRCIHFIAYNLNPKEITKESKSTNSIDIWQMQKVKHTMNIKA